MQYNLFAAGIEKTAILSRPSEHHDAMSPHRHSHYEIGLCIEGTTIHLYNNQHVFLSPGTIVYIAPGKYHHFINNHNTKMYNCQFTPESLNETSRQYFENKSFELQLHHVPLLCSYMTQLNKSTRETETISNEEIQWVFKEMIHQIVELDQTFKVNALQSEYNSDVILEQAVRYIKSNFDKTIPIEYLAKQLHTHPDHLSRLFRTKIGATPKDYINSLKLSKSAYYLRETDWAVKDIAVKVGIHDAGYFCRLFRKKIGNSPDEFRKNTTLAITRNLSD